MFFFIHFKASFIIKHLHCLEDTHSILIYHITASHQPTSSFSSMTMDGNFFVILNHIINGSYYTEHHLYTCHLMVSPAIVDELYFISIKFYRLIRKTRINIYSITTFGMLSWLLQTNNSSNITLVKLLNNFEIFNFFCRGPLHHHYMRIYPRRMKSLNSVLFSVFFVIFLSTFSSTTKVTKKSKAL